MCSSGILCKVNSSIPMAVMKLVVILSVVSVNLLLNLANIRDMSRDDTIIAKVVLVLLNIAAIARPSKDACETQSPNKVMRFQTTNGPSSPAAIPMNGIAMYCSAVSIFTINHQ